MPDLIVNNISNSFQVNLSDLENRLDPHFYKPEYAELIDKLNNSPNSKLGDVVQFSSETWNQKDHFEGTFPYIEISEIDLSTGAIKYIRQVPITEAPSRAKKIVRSGDIIVSTTRPIRGAISYITDEIDFSIASTGFSILRGIKPDAGVSLEYFFWILRQKFVLRQMEQRSSGGNYPAITEDELKKVLIPTPTEDEQEEIVELFKTALANRQSRIQESENLIAQIDSYILNELGITLPEKDTSIEARMFQTTFQELSGRRFDPFYNQKRFLRLEEIIQKAKYNTKALRELCNPARGVTYSGNDEIYTSNGIGILRANNITLETNELNFDDVRFIRKDFPVTESQKLKKNDILMSAASGSKEHVGKVAFIDSDIPYYFGGFMSVLRIKSGAIIPEYLFFFLRSSVYREVLFRVLGGTNINNLNFSMISGLQVPLPPIEKQIEISQEANRRRFEAQRLSLEADKVLEDARAEIEQMILAN